MLFAYTLPSLPSFFFRASTHRSPLNSPVCALNGYTSPLGPAKGLAKTYKPKLVCFGWWGRRLDRRRPRSEEVRCQLKAAIRLVADCCLLLTPYLLLPTRTGDPFQRILLETQIPDACGCGGPSPLGQEDWPKHTNRSLYAWGVGTPPG